MIGNASPSGVVLQEAVKRAGQGRQQQFSIYSIPPLLPLAASAAPSVDIQVNNDADFLIFAATGTSRDTGTGASQADRPFTLQVFDAGSGQNLFDRAQDFDACVGTAQRPAYWPMPRLIHAGSTMVVTVTNLIATARNVRLSFWGVKFYNDPRGGW